MRSLFLILDFIGVHPVIQIGLPESNDTPHLEVRDDPGLDLLIQPWHRNSEPSSNFRSGQNVPRHTNLPLSYFLSFVFGDTFLLITASKKV